MGGVCVCVNEYVPVFVEGMLANDAIHNPTDPQAKPWAADFPVCTAD